MSATRANVRELVRALRHMVLQSGISPVHYNKPYTLCERDVKDLLQALARVEEPPKKAKPLEIEP